MKKEINITFDDLFFAVTAISEDEEITFIDDLVDYLEQNPNSVFTITKYVND